MEFRDAVKYLRGELGLTQVELATGLNVNAVTVGRWENGKTMPNRAIAAVLLEYARAKGASEKCLDILDRSISAAAKDKLDLSGEGLYAVEHASLRQLIDDASFPIYVCDLETDELLYLNQKACAMVGGEGSAVGRKCHECLMHRDSPCDFCHKSELVEGKFISHDAYRPSDKMVYHVQGKLIQWNGRRAQVRYVLGREQTEERDRIDAEASAAIPPYTAEISDTAMGRLVLQSIENERSREQLKAIFENINGGVSVVAFGSDDRVCMAYANDRYYGLFGYTKLQFASELRDPHETLYPDDAEYVGAEIARIKSTRQAATFQYRVVKRDKSIAYLRCNSSVSSIAGLSDKVMISVLTDVTEAVQTERQAAVFGQRLDAIMKNIDSAVTAAMIKEDGSVEFLFSNDLYYEMLGYTKEQYDSEVSDPFQLVRPEDADAVRSAVIGMRHVGQATTVQYRVSTRTGQLRWLRARISIMSFPDVDRPVQLSVFTDVTDTVEASEQLAEQKNKIIEVLNETPSGIAVVEVDRRNVTGTLRTVYYNDRFFSFSGYDRDEYDRMLKKNEMAFVFNEDIPQLLSDTEKICFSEEGASVDMTIRCHTKDGGFRWLLLTGQLAHRRGDMCVVHIALVDITVRKEAIDRQRINEEMLRIAAETDKRAMIVYDVKNDRCRVESRTLFSAVYGENLNNIPQAIIDRGIVALDSVDELCAMFARIRNGEREIKASLQMCTGADRYEWFECNAATILDEAGQPDHAVLVFHNITEQRVKEAVFKKWQQSIETRPAESYTLFRCNLSKDASLDQQDGSLLKISYSPEMLSFNDRTKLYAEEYVCPDDRKAYSELLDSDTLLAMFYRGEHSAVLEYREVGANGEDLWRRLTVEMVEYLGSTDIQAFLMYEDIDDEKKAEIERREIAEADPLTGALNRAAFAGKVDELIRADPSMQSALVMLDMDGFKQLNDSFGHAAGDQALQEVVAVLRSYTRSGDLVCRLGGDEFLVWMRDIPYDAVIGKTVQQMCEHIRKAYSQEVLLSASAGIAVYPRDGHSYDELYPNADKALYRVKQAGKDSYDFFSVTGEEQTPEIAEAVSAVRRTPAASRGTRRRLLIVDDNETNRLILKNIFKDEYLIEIAKNGAEAMARLRHFGASISCVLLDLLMPGMDGFAVLKKMQSNTELRTIPVIVVTGDEERSTLLKAMELGAAEYVQKPVDIDIIRMRVQSVISKAENERLRAQNSYLTLQRDEEVKYRTVLESTGTVVVEYDWRNHVFTYDDEISKYIAGSFDHRSLWQVLLSDMVADSQDVKAMQDMLLYLGNRGQKQTSRLVRLKTPRGKKHWFRMMIYKRENEFGLAEKMIITFNDVHEEVLANDRLLFQATRDELTGLYNRAGFIEKAAELIVGHEPGYYVMACIDIEKFKVINDQYGTSKGDEVLRKFAQTLENLHHGENGICCRVMADNFAVLYPARLLDTPELEQSHRDLEALDDAIPTIRFAAGRCLVDDKTLSVSAIYDRATIAKNTVKGRFDTHIASFDEAIRTAILRQQEITGQMNEALEKGQFEVWFQPQFNHSTGMLSGAEALVRWRHPVEGVISPAEFIPIFERNGFVYEVDKYVWEQTCICLRRWLDQGLHPVPISVNISRCDVFRDDLIGVIEGLVKKYGLPREMLRLEITESAFSESSGQIIKVVKTLVDMGYTVEIDDFGSGYSSLNTLKDVPAQILKMDMRFLEGEGNAQNAQRGGSIIESVVRMAKWIGMSVIAEGVENVEQADYLVSIGCEYIQGYLYSRPQQVAEYEKLFAEGRTESRLEKLKTVETWNNDAFWNPSSMETLIFNSYVGGACIFEYNGGRTELLRYNAEYAALFGGNFKFDHSDAHNDILSVLDSKNAALFRKCITTAIETKKEASCEVELRGSKQELFMFIRLTVRLIAKTGDRHLFYCVVYDNTDQRVAEMKALEASERVNAVMEYSHCGITAIIVRENGRVEYLFTNNRFYEILGYTREQYEAEVANPFDCVYPEDRAAAFDAVTKLNKVGSTASLQMRDVRRDGSIVWLRCDTSIVKFENIPEPVQLSSFMDITEQKENEMKQLESARQLEVIMNNVSGGVSAVQIHDDGSSTMVFNNDKYYELYGYTTEQARAERLDVMSLILPEDLSGVMEKVRKLKADKQSTLIDYRVRKRDGSRALLRANASIMSIPGYGDDVITSVISDITEKKSLEDQLRAIVDNINGGVTATMIRDGKPEFIIVNDRFFKMLGYADSAEYELACGGDKYEHVHPEDRARIVAQFESSDGGKTRYTMEYRALHKDGSVRYIRNNVSVVHLFGYDEPIQLSVANDVTDMVEARQEQLAAMDRLRKVMNVMQSGMTAVAFQDGKMSFLFANDRYYEMHGIKRGDIGEEHLSSVLDLVVPEDRELMRGMVWGALKTGRTASAEYRIIRPDGAERWMSAVISMTSLVGIDAPVQVAVFSDITELKQANQQLRFLNDAAHSILAQPDSDMAIEKALEDMLVYFGGERSYIFEFNYETRTSDNTYEICADGVTSERDRLQGVTFEVQKFWMDAFNKDGFVTIPEISEIDDSEADVRELLLAQDIHSIIVAPLWRDSTLVGYMGIDNPMKAVDQVEQLQALADYIAVLLTRRDLNWKIAHDMDAIEQLINDTPGGFVRMAVHPGGDPTIVSLNEGMCRMLGMTRDEAMAAYGDNAHLFFTPEEIEETSKMVMEALKCCGQYSCKCTLHCKGGRELPVMAFGRFVKDETGKIFLNSYFTDVAVQMEAEQRQKTLLDNLPAGAALYEYDGKGLTAVHINRQYWKLVGRQPVDYGKTSVINAIHPDDRESAFQEIASAIRQKRNANVDARILYGENEYRPFHLTANITPAEDGRYLLFVSYTPIDGDTMSLQELLPIALSTITSNTDDMAYVKDRDLRYICVSRSVADMAGAESPRDLIGKTAGEVFSEAFSEKFDEDDSCVIKTGVSRTDILEHIPMPDGSIRLARTSKFPILDAHGKAAGVYCTSHDITAQRETESQLKLLTSSIPGGLAAYSMTGDKVEVVYFNDGFFSFSGYTREEYAALITDDPLALVLPEDRPALLQMLHDFAEKKTDGMMASCDYRCRTKDGEIRYMSLKTVLSQTGENKYVLNSVQYDVTEQKLERERLRVSEEEYRLATEHSKRTICRYNIADMTITVSAEAAKRLSLPEVVEDVPYGRVKLGVVSPDTADAYIKFYEAIRRGEKESAVVFRKHLVIGWRWLSAHATTAFNEEGQAVSAIISYVDVTEQQEKEAVYRKWKQNLIDRKSDTYTLYQTNLNKDGAFDTREGTLLDYFPTENDAKSLTDRARDFAERYVFDEDRELYLAFMNADTMLASYYRGKRTASIDFRIKSSEGALRWLRLTVELVEYPNSTDVEAYLLFEDINDSKTSEIRARTEAETDPLTGLLNRKAFASRVNALIEGSAPGARHAFFMLDIDGFKLLNDTFGHAAGDDALVEVARKMQTMLRQGDILARLGGDEFGVLLECETADGARDFAERIHASLDEFNADSNLQFPVTLSIGYAACDGEDCTIDRLIQQADAKMYMQKARRHMADAGRR